MRLDKLWISDFKNLRNVTIDFDENSLSTVLIGPNASAKSNLLEAIVLIFRNLDLFEDPPFVYNLKYSIGDRIVEIEADPSRSRDKTLISVDGEKISKKTFRENSRKYLPRNIFGYYSGTSGRFRECFSRHQDIFYRKIIYDEEPPLRPLFFAETFHGQYVLLAFFSFKEKSSLKFLDEFLGITGIQEIVFVLKQPYWYNRRYKDDLFWGARGVVRRFLEDLSKISIVTKKEKFRVTLPKTRRSFQEERFKLIIKNLDSFQKLASKYKNNVEFFKMLESTAISDLIHELKIKVIKKGVRGNIEFPQLSEGEQQLLIVLGLLKFMKEEESLFLLDEPDTHLNPAWKFEYLDLLETVVGGHENSHVIIVTHNPLVIGGLKKEQVQIFAFKDEDNNIAIYPPDIDPIGLGVDGLLVEIFGLETTLDLKTQKKLERRQELVVKKEISKDLSANEIKELDQLNDELLDMRFVSTVRDPLYTRFLTELRKHELSEKIKFSELEKKRQVELAKKIIAEIKKEAK